MNEDIGRLLRSADSPVAPPAAFQEELWLRMVERAADEPHSRLPMPESTADADLVVMPDSGVSRSRSRQSYGAMLLRVAAVFALAASALALISQMTLDRRSDVTTVPEPTNQRPADVTQSSLETSLVALGLVCEAHASPVQALDVLIQSRQPADPRHIATLRTAIDDALAAIAQPTPPELQGIVDEIRSLSTALEREERDSVDGLGAPQSFVVPGLARRMLVAFDEAALLGATCSPITTEPTR